MVKCLNCGHENLFGELICAQCSSPLGDVHNDHPRGVTQQLDDNEVPANYPRWGTAQLSENRQVVLHVRDYDTPLILSLPDTIELGRHDSATGTLPRVDLTSYGAEEKGVSRRHAGLFVEDNTLKVMDLGSANATYVNGQKLIAQQTRILRDGDELRLGHLVILVHFA